MAARELEVEVDISEMCLRCTVDTRRDRYLFSSRFRFGGAGWTLNYFKIGTHYSLYLRKCSGVPPHPLRVSVHVESSENGQIVKVLSREKQIRTQFEGGFFQSIWWNGEEEILRSVPEFRINAVLKLIVFLKPEGEECACATCRFTATDDNDPALESFLKDLGDLLDQDASTDLEFRCADADNNILTTVQAHKLLVCARSPVLAAMLHSDMVEGRTGFATVRDIDAGVFRQFLKFLYSGNLDETTVDMDTAVSLYEAGDRFQVGRLTRHCAKWIVRNLTIDNSCEVLLLADSHCNEEFAEATITFMANRGVPRVFDGWKDFCRIHPELSKRITECSDKLLKGMSTEGGYCCSRRRSIV